MRQRNLRIIVVGFLLTVMALGFYFFMLSISSNSTNPTELMQTVGTVSGGLVGISLVMVVVGLVGKKA